MKVIKTIGIILLILLMLILVTVIVLKNLKSVGKTPSKEDYLDYAMRSNNLNIEENKFFVPNNYYVDSMDIIGKKISNDDRKASWEIPVEFTDLNTKKYGGGVSPEDVYINWLGHSSIFIRMENMNFLIDPIFSKNASPVSIYGVERYSKVPVDLEKIAEIDAVLITHDHYDHLDYKTIKNIDKKTKQFIVPLGVEKHLIEFGIDKNKIKNLAWWESTNLSGVKIVLTPTVHHSGRFLNTRWTSLWGGYVFENTKGFKIYNTGDGGYGNHFAEIRDRIGTVDIILTDNGQYNEAWHKNHMFPEEAYKAAQIMEAKYLIPTHVAAYSLSPYPWNDAFVRLKNIESNVKVISPRIGEMVDYKDIENYTENWWIKK